MDAAVDDHHECIMHRGARSWLSADLKTSQDIMSLLNRPEASCGGFGKRYYFGRYCQEQYMVLAKSSMGGRTMAAKAFSMRQERVVAV